jgi:quinol monooxygenase YgiN
MSVAFVLDFAGGTREQYDHVVDRMQLGGRMAPGGLMHVAGEYEGGWRVIDIWEDREQFERFRDEKIIPHARSAGMPPPNVQMMEIETVREGNGQPAELVQCVILPGLDHASFQVADEQVVPGGAMPPEITFHVNGPIDGGWCVIDGWTSKEARDHLVETRIKPAMAAAPLTGPPRIEDLMVQATIPAAATART